MARRIIGKYWMYTGNSDGGRDHERKTPRGYTLAEVTAVAAILDSGNGTGCTWLEDLSAVTPEEWRASSIQHHRGDSFGHEVTVKAPKSLWDKALSIVAANTWRVE